jgi:hypothetical protein
LGCRIVLGLAFLASKGQVLANRVTYTLPVLGLGHKINHTHQKKNDDHTNYDEFDDALFLGSGGDFGALDHTCDFPVGIHDGLVCPTRHTLQQLVQSGFDGCI